VLSSRVRPWQEQNQRRVRSLDIAAAGAHLVARDR